MKITKNELRGICVTGMHLIMGRPLAACDFGPGVLNIRCGTITIMDRLMVVLSPESYGFRLFVVQLLAIWADVEELGDFQVNTHHMLTPSVDVYFEGVGKSLIIEIVDQVAKKRESVRFEL